VLGLGLDAAGKAGWVGVAVDERGFVGAYVAPLASEVLAAAEAAAGVAADVVAIDIPIGLVAAPTRSADRAARTFVGPRSSSVFPAPHPEVLELPDHASVNLHLAAIEMPRVSAQAFHLFARIREVAGLAADPRVVEAFPEASFCGMKGDHLRTTKKTWAGQHERRALLAAARPAISVPDDLGPAGSVPADDVLDAAAVAWSALRHAHGEARQLGDPDERDAATGRAAVVWW
jgi:predicted RNase H-like nuclease